MITDVIKDNLELESFKCYNGHLLLKTYRQNFKVQLGALLRQYDTKDHMFTDEKVVPVKHCSTSRTIQYKFSRHNKHTNFFR